MEIVCLDLEGTLVPEIWQEVAKATGIEELNLTTKDEPDYDKLMTKRLSILKEHNITIHDIEKIVSEMNPYEGAVDFLDGLRRKTRVILLSDTFQEFVSPLMEKLHYPTIFCHSLDINEEGIITDYNLRIRDQKKAAVAAFHLLGFRVFSAGDSLNDISMIGRSDSGVLFRTSKEIAENYGDIDTMSTYEELNKRIDAFLEGEY